MSAWGTGEGTELEGRGQAQKGVGLGLKVCLSHTLPSMAYLSREEKAELLLDSQEEVQGLEAEIRRLRQEVLSDPPAPHYFPSPIPLPPSSAPSHPLSIWSVVGGSQLCIEFQFCVLWPRLRRCRDRPSGLNCIARRWRLCGSGWAACPDYRKSWDGVVSGFKRLRLARASWK